MYCRKCGKDYNKSKKVCSDCGAALVPGNAPSTANQKIKKRVFIIGGVVALLVIAFFVIVGVTGYVSTDIKGVWYHNMGFGTMEFQSGGIVTFKMFNVESSSGEFEYDSKTRQGRLSMEEGEEMSQEFVFDGETIQMDDGNSVYTREEVEQFDFENLIDEATKDD